MTIDNRENDEPEIILNIDAPSALSPELVTNYGYLMSMRERPQSLSTVNKFQEGCENVVLSFRASTKV